MNHVAKTTAYCIPKRNFNQLCYFVKYYVMYNRKDITD